MNKQEFFNGLSYEIRNIPKPEQEKAIFYYREIIDDAIEAGENEEDAIARLGSIEEIAREINISSDRVRKESMSSGRKVLTTILLILGFPIWGSLVLVLLCLVLVAFILLFVPIIILVTFVVAFFASGIWAIIGTPFIVSEGLAYAVMQLGAGVSLLGLSVLSGLGFYYCIGSIKKGAKALWGFVKRIFNKGVIV